MKTALVAFAASLAFALPAVAQDHDHGADHAEGHSQHVEGQHVEGQAGDHQHEPEHYLTARHAEHRLRETIEAMQAGSPNYDMMVPTLADAVRATPDAMTFLQAAGAIQTLEHVAEPQSGTHEFRVVFANGSETVWIITMNNEDRIAGLTLSRPS